MAWVSDSVRSDSRPTYQSVHGQSTRPRVAPGASTVSLIRQSLWIKAFAKCKWVPLSTFWLQGVFAENSFLLMCLLTSECARKCTNHFIRMVGEFSLALCLLLIATGASWQTSGHMTHIFIWNYQSKQKNPENLLCCSHFANCRTLVLKQETENSCSTSHRFNASTFARAT